MRRIYKILFVVLIAGKVSAQQFTKLSADDEHLTNPEMNIRLYNNLKDELTPFYHQQLRQNNRQLHLTDDEDDNDDDDDDVYVNGIHEKVNNWNNNLIEELLKKIHTKLLMKNKQLIMNNMKKPENDENQLQFYGNNELNKRGALALARRSQKLKNFSDNNNGVIIPSISVGEFHEKTKGLNKFGALTNLQGFFDNLKNNLETMEKKPLHPEQMKFLDGDNNSSLKKEFISDDYHVKPSGTAAFLHAIRNYRPSSKVRALVSLNPSPFYQNTNFHDPSFLYTGLGK